MSGTTSPQFCAICAWRENCAKKFCVADGGARCPDFSRDISIKNVETAQTEVNATGEDGKEQ